MHDENFSLKAGANLSACQYHIMRISDGLGQVNIASLATDNGMIGVLINAPALAGRGAAISLFGEGKVVAGAAMGSAGIWFTCNGSGRAIAATSGQMVAGRILETAVADGDVVRCLHLIPYRLSGAP